MMLSARFRQPVVLKPSAINNYRSPLIATLPANSAVECLVGDLFFGNASTLRLGNSVTSLRPTLTIVGPPTPHSNVQLATDYQYDSTHYVSKRSKAGTDPWTVAGIFAIQSTGGGGDFSVIGTCDGVGSGTYDRQIQYNPTAGAGSTPAWEAYLFDGAGKRAVCPTIQPGTLRPDVVVATTDGSTLWCYAGIYGTSTVYVGSIAVSNAGYNAYSTPTFCIGNPSNNPILLVQSALWLRLIGPGAFWTAAQATSFIQNPWQVYAPLTRATQFFASSVAVTGLLAVGGGSGGQGGGVVTTAVGSAG